ncbi:MAG: hypothetical protein KIT58_05250 [Planctomycetota bacterium]|nr:hypothetical protein [Planctomycetota bacterium]
MATLPDDDVLRAAVGRTTAGVSDAQAASARQTAARIPGVESIEARGAVIDVLRLLERRGHEYPLGGSASQALMWRETAGRVALALAMEAQQAGRGSWDLAEVVAEVERVARADAEDAARQLAEAHAAEQARREAALADEQARLEAAEADRRAAAEQARRERLEWTAVAVELDLRNLYRAPCPEMARQRFADDLLAAQDEVALIRAEREAELAMAERRSTRLATSMGLAGAAFLVAGWAFPVVRHEADSTGERRTERAFNWSAAFGAGCVGWLVGRLAGPWLISHAGDIRRGAALLPKLGAA